MKFTKENFQKKYKPKETEDLEEDVIGGGGDKVITSSEISTDTQVATGVDKSGREKGMSKTMDKHIAQTRNPSATFGYGGEMGVAFGGRQGNMHVNGGGMNLDVNDEDAFKGEDEVEEELTESSKDKMRRMVKELMDARTNPNDIVSKTNDITLNNKTTELIKILKTKTPEEVQNVLNLITSEVVGDDDNKPNL